MGLSAHQVTLAALVAQLVAAVAIGSGDRGLFITGVALLYVAFWLDHVDGQVARWRRTASLDGVYFDYLMHHAGNLTLGFALGHGLGARTGDSRWSIAGFAVSLGWTFLSLHNDCQYKAFFQRLKSANGCFRVDGGSGGRPRPPMPWPGRGWQALTWPAFKMCEPHVVLLALLALVILALGAPALWLGCWSAAVAGWAVLGPRARDRAHRPVDRPKPRRARVRALVRAPGICRGNVDRRRADSGRIPLDMTNPSLYHQTKTIARPRLLSRTKRDRSSRAGCCLS